MCATQRLCACRPCPSLLTRAHYLASDLMRWILIAVVVPPAMAVTLLAALCSRSLSVPVALR